MSKIISNDKINLEMLFFKIRKSWYWIALSLLVALSAAIIYIKFTNPVYEVQATIIVEDQSSGSKEASELLSVMDIKNNRGISLEDEIGKLKSYAMIEKAINNLNFNISYFEVPDILPNRLGKNVVRELYNNTPFQVILDYNSLQLVNTPIYIEFLSKNKARLTIPDNDVELYDFDNNKSEVLLEKFRYRKVVTLNEPYQDKYISLQINLSESMAEIMKKGSSYYFTINKAQSLIKQYQSKLTIEPFDRDSRILVLRTQGEVPQKEEKFLNTLIDVYIQQDLENKNVTGQRTVEFIDNQLSTITDSLQQAEVALQSFRSTNKIMDIGYASSTIFEKLDRLEQEKSQTEIKLRYYQNIHKYLQEDQDISEIMSPSAVGVEDPVLSSLIIELNRLYQQKAGLNYSSKQENPAILSLDNQIRSAKSSLIENLRNLIGSTTSTLGFINQQINEIENNIRRLPESERRLVNLQRKFDFNDQTYNFFLQKKAEAAISLATNMPDRKFIDTAQILDLVAPKKTFAILLAMMLGLFLPVGLIVASDSFNNKITSKGQLKEMSDIPILGMIAHAPGNRNVFDLYQNRKSALAESFNSIRLNLQYFTLDNSSKVIGVTSSISGEGKTFFSINLALEMAIAEQRVILIGADLRKPKMQEYVGGVVKIKKGFGLSTFLANKTKLEEIIHKSPLNNLDIIPAGPIPPNPLDLMGSGKMKALVETLKQHYDFVILDTPPIGYVSEYMVIKEFTDANIYMVRYNYSTTNSLKEINDLYDQKKIKNLCFVLNDVNFTRSYEYGYRSKAYKQYYSRKSKKDFTISINKPSKKKMPLK